jgi:hypothetical protein
VKVLVSRVTGYVDLLRFHMYGYRVYQKLSKSGVPHQRLFCELIRTISWDSYFLPVENRTVLRTASE